MSAINEGIDPKVRARLDRLWALAQRGIGGERETAEKVLIAMLRQIGLTLPMYAALADDASAVDFAEWSYRDVRDRSLLTQVIKMVIGRRQQWSFRKKKALGAEVTPREKADISTLWPIFRKAWRESEEELFMAFVLRNGIHAPPSGDDHDEDPDPMDPAKRDRIVALAQGIDRTHARKQLTAGGAQ